MNDYEVHKYTEQKYYKHSLSEIKGIKRIQTEFQDLYKKKFKFSGNKKLDTIETHEIT